MRLVDLLQQINMGAEESPLIASQIDSVMDFIRKQKGKFTGKAFKRDCQGDCSQVLAYLVDRGFIEYTILQTENAERYYTVKNLPSRDYLIERLARSNPRHANKITGHRKND